MVHLIADVGHGEPSLRLRAEAEGHLFLGDNLPTLLALAKTPLKGAVRLIYIDPPFGTGQTFNARVMDEVAYHDTIIGKKFIEFLRPRLQAMRELLAEDGSIYLHIDTKIGHHVKVLMDEVFGPENFINDITRVKCNPKNFQRRAYGNMKDMILFYSKTSDYVWNEAREEMKPKDIERLFPKTDKAGRHYTTTPLHAPGETANGATGKPWKGIDPPKGRHWRYRPDELTRLDEAGLIEWSSTKNPRLRIYAADAERNGKKRQDIWEFKDPAHPEYPTEKNPEMLKVILEASSNPGDLVMDAFCGSGSTLLAAHELKRKWIGMDKSPLSAKVVQRRLKERGADFEVQDTPGP